MRTFMITIFANQHINNFSFNHVFYQSPTFPRRMGLMDQLNRGRDGDDRLFGQIVSIVEVSEQDRIEFEA